MKRILLGLATCALATSQAIAQEKRAPSVLASATDALMAEPSLPQLELDEVSDPSKVSDSSPPPPPSRAPVAGELRGAQVFVYSFLDIREQDFGFEVVEGFEKRLLEDLKIAGVPAKLLRYSDTSVSQNYPARGKGSSWIPIGQVIDKNIEEEASIGTRYRLIIFPTKMAVGGLGREYTVRWTLFDARTGFEIWSFKYRSMHSALFSAKISRAEKLVLGGVNAMRKARLF